MSMLRSVVTWGMRLLLGKNKQKKTPPLGGSKTEFITQVQLLYSHFLSSLNNGILIFDWLMGLPLTSYNRLWSSSKITKINYLTDRWTHDMYGCSWMLLSRLPSKPLVQSMFFFFFHEPQVPQIGSGSTFTLVCALKVTLNSNQMLCPWLHLKLI